MSASAKNIYQYGSTGIAVPSTIAGQNINQSGLAWKNFSPLVLSSTMATQLPNCPCMNVKICNQLGNDQIAVGGLPGSNDDPYFVPNNPGLARGTLIPPGQCHIFKVTNSNLLTVIAARNGDIISLQACLSQADFATSTADPPPDTKVYPTPMILSVTPSDTSTNRPIGNDIVAVLNTPVLGANSTNVFLRRHSDNFLIPGVVTLSPDGMTVTFNPTANLTTFTQYDFELLDLENAVLVSQTPNPFFSTFTTGKVPTKFTLVEPSLTVSDTAVIHRQKRHAISEPSLSVSDSVAVAKFHKYTVGISEPSLSVSDSVAAVKNPIVQLYSVTGDVSPCASNGVSWGPAVISGSVCEPGNTGSDFFGLAATSNRAERAFGEIASVANGLVGHIVKKVVLQTVIGTNNQFASTSSTAPTGVLGIEIVNSSGVVQYTFSSTFTSSGTGYTNQCTVSCTPSIDVYGWTNITLTDNANTHTMVAGDAVLVTWTGTGPNNVIAMLTNRSPTYGKGVYLDDSNVYTTLTDCDLAAVISGT